MDEPLVLAREALTYYLKTGRYLKLPADSKLLKQKAAGVFICLKKDGRLRGCMGTVQGTKPSLAEEIVYNTVLAATADPRFPPVSFSELDKIELAVDILSAPEPAAATELNPKVYGVIVTNGQKSGLLLPDLEGVNTIAEQLKIAKLKAGLKEGESYQLYRFTVQRFAETQS